MGDQFPISSAASPDILHHTVWITWLFIASSDRRWFTTNSQYLTYTFFFNVWENILWTWEWKVQWRSYIWDTSNPPLLRHKLLFPFSTISAPIRSVLSSFLPVHALPQNWTFKAQAAAKVHAHIVNICDQHAHFSGRNLICKLFHQLVLAGRTQIVDLACLGPLWSRKCK